MSSWFAGLPWQAQLPLGLLLAYGLIMTVMAVVVAAMRLAELALVAGIRMTGALTAMLTSGVLWLAGMAGFALKGALDVLAWAASRAIGAVPAPAWAGVLRDRWTWHREFRDSISWRDFRDQMAADPAPAPVPVDDYAEHCRVLGLRDGFTRTDLDAAFRRLQRAAHPDHQGSEWMAARVNLAREEILKRKGWKK